MYVHVRVYVSELLQGAGKRKQACFHAAYPNQRHKVRLKEWLRGRFVCRDAVHHNHEDAERLQTAPGCQSVQQTRAYARTYD